MLFEKDIAHTHILYENLKPNDYFIHFFDFVFFALFKLKERLRGEIQRERELQTHPTPFLYPKKSWKKLQKGEN